MSPGGGSISPRAQPHQWGSREVGIAGTVHGGLTRAISSLSSETHQEGPQDQPKQAAITSTVTSRKGSQLSNATTNHGKMSSVKRCVIIFNILQLLLLLQVSYRRSLPDESIFVRIVRLIQLGGQISFTDDH